MEEVIGSIPIRSTKFARAFVGDKDIRRLNIAMNDAALVSSLQFAADLKRDVQQ